MPSQKRHMFICGCPRSGTTALWRMLSHDPRILLGVERFGNRFSSPSFIGPEHFERARYFDLQPGDTFYDSLDGFSPIYAKQREQWDKAVYVGDKIPQLFRHLPKIRARFPGAKILMIYRNLFDVAASYKRRSENPDDPDWPEGKGALSAIQDWKQAVWAYNNFGKAMGALPLDYEVLFSDPAPLEAIYSYLDLDLSPAMRTVHANTVKRAQNLETDRQRGLTEAEAKAILMQAPIPGYRKIIEEAAAYAEEPALAAAL